MRRSFGAEGRTPRHLGNSTPTTSVRFRKVQSREKARNPAESLALARLHPQSIVDPGPCAVVAPLGEGVVASAPRWQILGHHPPGAAASGDVEDAIEHLAEVDGA